MLKRKSLSVNAVLNAIKTVLSLVFPLLIFPYVSRVLGVEGVGRYNFSVSIVSYFVLIAGLGISTYAIREGTCYRENRQAFSRFASEMFSINMFSTMFAYILLCGALLVVDDLQGYSDLIVILSLEILFVTIGVNWIFSIFEEFVYLAVKGLFFQFIALVLVFLFVKDESDLVMYTAIMMVPIVVGGVVDFVMAKKFCKLQFITSFQELKKHLKPILILFSTSVAITLYVNSDITLIGFFADDHAVGLYSVSAKIYTLFKQVIVSVLVVMIPRFSLMAHSDRAAFSTFFCKTLMGVAVVLLPAIIGVMMLAEEIICIVAGEAYLLASGSLILLMGAAIFSLLAFLLTQCVLIPFKQEKVMFKATITAAAVNVALNLLLMAIFRGKEIEIAAITTIVAEIVVVVITYLTGKSFVHVNIQKRDICSIAVGCLAVAGCCHVVKYFFDNTIITLAIAVLTSIVVYGVIVIAFGNSMVTSIIRRKS